MNIAFAAPVPSMADDFPPFELVDGDPAAGVLILCDHADNRLPAEYGDLGLSAAEFRRHIAYDPGAAAVTRSLARRLGVPAVLSTFSRLLIDPNRGEDDPTLIMRLSDGAVVPGNAAVDASERARRIVRFHAPYHAAIDAAIERALAGDMAPIVVSVHSFTPVWRGALRPWHAGVLWDRDPRIALPLIAALREAGDLVVGDNEPYAGALANDCMYRHASRRGLAHGLVEIRQDLIGEAAGAEAWAERLARIVSDLNRLAGVHAIRRYGSNAGGLDDDAGGDGKGATP
jgi:predicted N-formylglutamate amidohydrolase